MAEVRTLGKAASASETAGRTPVGTEDALTWDGI